MLCTDLQIVLALLQLLGEGLNVQSCLAHFEVSCGQLRAQLLRRLLLLLLQLLAAVKSSLVTDLERLIFVMVQLLELALNAITLSLHLQQSGCLSAVAFIHSFIHLILHCHRGQPGSKDQIAHNKAKGFKSTTLYRASTHSNLMHKPCMSGML